MIDKPEFTKRIVALGATKAGAVQIDEIVFSEELRKSCERNHCGNYNRNWTCPPQLGTVGELIERVKGYDFGVVYQTIHNIEDSFDIEGMMDAGKKHANLVVTIQKDIIAEFGNKALILGAGGCPHCQRCAKATDEPCRFPDKAIASVEAYGMYVSELAKSAGMKYINGQNTITYFGMVLLKM